MNIQVNGKQIDVGQALGDHVRARLADGVSKYFDGLVNAAVTFSRDGTGFRTDCHVHLRSGTSLSSHANHDDIYASFDQAAERMEKQLRRYKRRLVDHHPRARTPALGSDHPDQTIEATLDEDQSQDGDALQGNASAIIAESVDALPVLSVSQAVEDLDTKNAQLVLFRNRTHLGLNVVYRRADGHIGWIDPANGTQQGAS